MLVVGGSQPPKQKGTNMKKRMSKDRYYLDIAASVAMRGTCLRRNYGAVIVNDDQIVSTGYTGAPRDTDSCVRLSCVRSLLSIQPGERYDLCASVHAEANAIIHANRRDMLGGTMYLSGVECSNGDLSKNVWPCYLCQPLILNAGIETVVIEGSNYHKIEKMNRKEMIERFNGWVDKLKDNRKG